MKVLCLRAKNIHSLKGEHEINFENKPLSDAGLFAITGPTGAGKSTILDIITLALFNKMPRFGTISNKVIEEIGSVVTHNTKDAYAEIDYVVNDLRYRSTWSIKLNKNNNWNDYTMCVATIHDTKILESKKSEVPGVNEKIIGLNYDQFRRAILLAQGEFALFLKSKGDERAKLLEEITGTQIYRSLGKAAFEKSKMCDLELNNLKIQLSSFQNIENLNVEETQKELKNQELKLLSLIQEIVFLTEQVNVKIVLEKIAKQKQDLERESNILHEKIKIFEPNLIRIKNYEQILPFKTELYLWKEENAQLIDNLGKIEISEKKILEEKSLYENAIDSLSKFIKKEVAAQTFLAQLRAYELLYNEKLSDLNVLKNLGVQAKENLYGQISKHKDEIFQKISQKDIDTSQMLTLISARIKILENFLEQNLDEQNLIDENENFNQAKSKLEIQLQNTNTYQNLKKELDVKKLAVEKTNAEISTHSKDLENTEKIEIKIEEKVLKLQKAKEQQLKLINLTALRDELEDGKECPLCGSTDHPYADHSKIKNYLNANIALDEALKEQKLIKANLLSKQKLLAETIGNLKILRENLNVIHQSISEVEDKDGKENLCVSAIDLQHKITEIEKIISVSRSKLTHLIEHKNLKECLNLLERLLDLRQKFITKQNEVNQLYSGNDFNKEVNEIQRKFNESQQSLSNLNTYINTYKEQNIALYKSVKTKLEVLLPKINTLGYKDLDDIFAYLIPENEYTLLKNEQEKIKSKKTQISTLENQLKLEWESTTQLIKSDKTTMELQEEINSLEALKDNINKDKGKYENQLNIYFENLKRIKSIELKIEQHLRSSRKWQLLNKYIGDSTGNKYSKWAQNLTLQHLIAISNQRLKKLNDRYLLSYSNIDEDLFVNDLYQGNIKRSVRTLSGGESFIVSLALALSLSDMASKNIKLESLFIDEGFGTLDQETLESAIDTLEKLQSETKRVIGIISHIDTLKERIQTQINLVKTTSGFSKISIV